jgi:hypothetical protein
LEAEIGRQLRKIFYVWWVLENESGRNQKELAIFDVFHDLVLCHPFHGMNFVDLVTWIVYGAASGSGSGSEIEI